MATCRPSGDNRGHPLRPGASRSGSICPDRFTHANINLKFDKPLRYVLASPHYHRWHHAGEKHAYNKNYCAMFSLIDLMFGTYYHPERLPKGYGLEPLEQKDYPDGLLGWLAYPFKQVAKNFKTKKEA